MSKTLDESLVKKPHQKESWTENQILEIAKCLNPLTGPAHFISNYFYIQHPIKGKIIYQPFDYQRRLLDVYHRYKYSIAMLPRQSGKCVHGDTLITVKNVKTQKVYKLPIQIFHELQTGANQDISMFEV